MLIEKRDYEDLEIIVRLNLVYRHNFLLRHCYSLCAAADHSLVLHTILIRLKSAGILLVMNGGMA